MSGLLFLGRSLPFLSKVCKDGVDSRQEAKRV